MRNKIVYKNDRPVNIIVFHEGRPYIAARAHPNFSKILDALRRDAPPEEILDLFDTASGIVRRFRGAQAMLKSLVGASPSQEDPERFAERLLIDERSGAVSWDGEPVHGSLADTVLAYARSGEEDFLPLLQFMIKVMKNPNEHSRVQLFDWLAHLDFSITPDGDIISYKGVRAEEDEKGVMRYRSTAEGKAIVDGVVHEGFIPYAKGSVVEMPREEVAHNPSDPCGTGLHVGTRSYARSYGTLITVRINPMDVVSVPTDSYGQKMRTCRYVVEDVLDEHGSLRDYAMESVSPSSADDEDVEWTFTFEDGLWSEE